MSGKIDPMPAWGRLRGQQLATNCESLPSFESTHPCTLLQEPLTTFVAVGVNVDSVGQVRGVGVDFHPCQARNRGQTGCGVYSISNRRRSPSDDAVNNENAPATHILREKSMLGRKKDSYFCGECEVRLKMQQHHYNICCGLTCARSRSREYRAKCQIHTTFKGLDILRYSMDSVWGHSDTQRCWETHSFDIVSGGESYWHDLSLPTCAMLGISQIPTRVKNLPGVNFEVYICERSSQCSWGDGQAIQSVGPQVPKVRIPGVFRRRKNGQDRDQK